MKIISDQTPNKEIEIIKLIGELTGNYALELHDYLHTCLDKGTFLLINLKQVIRIDGLGINILENYLSRGLQIRLFNVGIEIRLMFRISRKEGLFTIYDETDQEKAVSLFEEEILGKDTLKENIKKRQYLRVNTFIQAEFKYNPRNNGVISARTNVLNLSEGGMLADQIKASNPKTGEIIVQPEISGQELYDLKFSLNGNSGLIEAKGECVREIKTYEKQCAGICFKDIKAEYRKKIRDYVFKT